MGYSARVLLDSVSPVGVRLVTLEASFPRFVLAEFNTHRTFCLDGETKLYFDLPSKLNKGETRRFAMTLAELFEKWHHGSAPRANRRRVKSASCNAAGLNRQPLRGRLAAMKLRSCNEESGEIYHTSIRDVIFSGHKPVFEIRLTNGQKILSTMDHRFLTRSGWQRLEDAVGLRLSPGNVASWKNSPEFAVNGIAAYKDPQWLGGLRDAGLSAAQIAAYVGVTLDQVKYQFRKHGLRSTNPEAVWHLSHVEEPWNKGRRYSNLVTRGRASKARVRKGPESHLWRGGITPQRKLIGAWTVRRAFSTHRANGFKCVLCSSTRELHAHHVDPVAHNPDRAVDPTNLTSLCRTCHRELHRRNLELLLLDHVRQGESFASFWDTVGGLSLRKPWAARPRRAMVRHFVALASVKYVGVRATYDVEVEGPYHNFIADGFVVHNSRNSASSRAVPTAKLIERVENEPAVPLEWGRNKAGMSASEVLALEQAEVARAIWLRARDDAVAAAKALMELNVHKQELNRLLEPFLWHTVIVTATEWSNFFELRCTTNAQPEIRAAAVAMRDAIRGSVPSPIAHGRWHTPLLQPDEATLDEEVRKRVSVARCARVSYLTHGGTREIEKDLELYERLQADRHLSPFEHVATPARDAAFYANFRGWLQMRREVEADGVPRAAFG